MMSLMHNKKIRVWVPPIAGFLFYGAWAGFINYAHGWESAITAGLTQGSYSFLITLVLAMVVEWLFVRLKGAPLRSFWVFLAGFLLLSSSSISANLLTGTAEILWTVLPGLTVSLVYTVVYILALNKLAV
ncbi:MAG: hypothetical protein ACI9D5_002476 [Candidatus Endobugula sp.]|jgi:hypothetical protein